MRLELFPVLLCIVLHLNRADITTGTVLTDESNATYFHELNLRKLLLKNYNVHVLPPTNHNTPIQVDIRLALVSIRELNERSERLTLETFVQLVWNDSRLSWTEQDYGGIKSLRFPSHKVWQPDIKLFNSARASEKDPWGDVYAVITSKGNVRWLPPATFHSMCNVDLRLYPYDVQDCHLKFGSWTLNGNQVDLALYNNRTEIELSDSYNENNEWEIIGSQSSKAVRYYSCCEEPFPEVVYALRLRRRAPYYKLTTLYPALAVVALTLASFWLPPTSTERITLGCISLIILVVLLMHLSWKLPPTGKYIPMIVLFCGNGVIVITASIILSLISITISRAPHNRPGPALLRTMANSWFGKILGVSTTPLSHGIPTEENNLDYAAEDGHRFHTTVVIGKEHYIRDWINCMKMLDRINFFIFIVVFALVLGSSYN